MSSSFRNPRKSAGIRKFYYSAKVLFSLISFYVFFCSWRFSKDLRTQKNILYLTISPPLALALALACARLAFGLYFLVVVSSLLLRCTRLPLISAAGGLFAYLSRSSRAETGFRRIDQRSVFSLSLRRSSLLIFGLFLWLKMEKTRPFRNSNQTGLRKHTARTPRGLPTRGQRSSQFSASFFFFIPALMLTPGAFFDIGSVVSVGFL